MRYVFVDSVCRAVITLLKYRIYKLVCTFRSNEDVLATLRVHVSQPNKVLSTELKINGCVLWRRAIFVKNSLPQCALKNNSA